MRSPKTAGHDGHAERLVPLAPELESILSALFASAEPGVDAIIPMLRDSKQNFRTNLNRIIWRASVKPSPRVLHNLRASFATDRMARCPGRDVAAWLGHSLTFAAKHDWQPRDVYMDLAAGRPARDAETGADSDARPAQNAAQQPPASDRKGSGESAKEPSFSGALRADASVRESAANEGNGRNRTRTCAGC